MTTKPKIDKVEPAGAIPGGEIVIRGERLHGSNGVAPQVAVGGSDASIIFAADQKIIARVPDASGELSVQVKTESGSADGITVQVGASIAEGLHPVSNPAIDADGNIYATYSGSRGQTVPVSIFRVEPGEQPVSFVRGLMNATGLAFGPDKKLYVSSRNEGVVYRVARTGEFKSCAEGMGIATGLAFDPSGNLFVGDRSGSIFKVGPDGQIFVFATLEPSVAAYHLAFGPEGLLYVTGPTTTSYDSVYRITVNGEIELFYRGLGRPQGLAFGKSGSLYVAASLGGRRGIVRIDREGRAELVVSGNDLVGLAFAPDRRMILATSSSLFQLDWDEEGLPLPPPAK